MSQLTRSLRVRIGADLLDLPLAAVARVGLLVRVSWSGSDAQGGPLLLAQTDHGPVAVLSAAAFALWAALLKHNRVGTVTVFNFLIPVFGALLSALFLGEEILAWRNLIALCLVCVGIWQVTTEAAAATVPTR